MQTAIGAIHGWSPSGCEDEDVNVSPDMRFMTIKPFPPSSSTFLSPICPPLDPCPQPATAPHPPAAPSSDRRAQRNRSRDPSWIPRPRNAFIIFRCEYSREHSQGQEAHNDNDATNPSMKTLSKRAADAWKQLPPSERDRYKLLADREREEHARLYPHYRFRPMKRNTSKTGKTSCERSQGPVADAIECRPALSTHLPSVLASSSQKPRLDPSAERTEESAPMPQASAVPFPDPALFPFDLEADLQMPFTVDYNDPLFTPSPETSLLPGSSSPVDQYSPFCAQTLSTAPDTFSCNDSAFNHDLIHEDIERAQALEAYAIGLYNYDLLSPFTFPEYC